MAGKRDEWTKMPAAAGGKSVNMNGRKGRGRGHDDPGAAARDVHFPSWRGHTPDDIHGGKTDVSAAHSAG